MKIETKFNIGDTLWFSFADKPTPITVSEIHVFAGKETSIQYFSDLWSVNEEDLFATKEELLNSL